VNTSKKRKIQLAQKRILENSVFIYQSKCLDVKIKYRKSDKNKRRKKFQRKLSELKQIFSLARR
jgi:hypothetical protein